MQYTVELLWAPESRKRPEALGRAAVVEAGNDLDPGAFPSGRMCPEAWATGGSLFSWHQPMLARWLYMHFLL